MTKTALELYSEQDNLLTISFLEDKITNADLYIKKLKLLEQAKAIEKEEKKLFYDCGRLHQLTGEGTFNQVYNETYGNK